MFEEHLAAAVASPTAACSKHTQRMKFIDSLLPTWLVFVSSFLTGFHSYSTETNLEPKKRQSKFKNKEKTSWNASAHNYLLRLVTIFYPKLLRIHKKGTSKHILELTVIIPAISAKSLSRVVLAVTLKQEVACMHRYSSTYFFFVLLIGEFTISARPTTLLLSRINDEAAC